MTQPLQQTVWDERHVLIHLSDGQGLIQMSFPGPNQAVLRTFQIPPQPVSIRQLKEIGEAIIVAVQEWEKIASHQYETPQEEQSENKTFHTGDASQVPADEPPATIEYPIKPQIESALTSDPYVMNDGLNTRVPDPPTENWTGKKGQ